MEVPKRGGRWDKKNTKARSVVGQGNALDSTTLRAAPVHSRPGVHAVERSRKEKGMLEMLARSSHDK